MTKVISFMLALAMAGTVVGNSGAEPASPEPTKANTPASTIVEGAHVNIVAQWNERKDEVGRYQAPPGYIIKSAIPRVRSETRSSYNVTISADKREASLSVSVRGKNEFWNKVRGWFDGYLQIELQPAS
jgi:hypothetical protein